MSEIGDLYPKWGRMSRENVTDTETPIPFPPPLAGEVASKLSTEARSAKVEANRKGETCWLGQRACA